MFDELTRPEIHDLAPYAPGKPIEEVRREYGLTDIIKMASNENPFGPSPKALAAIEGELPALNQYPEGTCPLLRQALAAELDLGEDQIVITNGGSNLLLLITLAFVNPGEEVVLGWPTFPVIRRATLMMGGKVVAVPLKNHVHDLRAMAAAITPRTKLVYICNPNNPTGTVAANAALEEFLGALPPGVIAVLDEVYIDFSTECDPFDGQAYLDGSRPVISVRSFSKLYGLAGLRVGYGLGHPDLMAAVNKVREAFPVNRPAQTAALAALADSAYKQQVIAANAAQREHLAQALTAMGWACPPSQANFVYVDFGRDSQPIVEDLLRQGIIIRPMAIWGQPTCARITVGTPKQNDRLLAAMEKIVA